MNMKWIPTAAATAVVLFLAGCGGGGGGGGVPATETTTPVGVTVIDGAIRNALVCLDKNLNSACDADEPSARTDVSGNATLQVDQADAGKYPVVAVVGTDAVDADHGPVTTAFTLKAPADKPAVVSPLTTLVQTKIEATGSSTADAESIVQSQLGMNVSLFTDFTKDTSTEGATLGAMARLIVVTTQEQSKTLEASVGTEAIDGSTISAADIDEIIRRKLLEIVPRLVATLADPAVQTAIATGDPTAINAALTPKVADVVASTNLTATTVGTVVGIANQAASGPEAAETPAASASLAGLDFSDTAYWSRRMFTSSLAQGTPDASGNLRFIERRSRSYAGAVAHWSVGGAPYVQSDLHWNGSSWVDCPIGSESTQPPRDAAGRTAYNYCNGREHGFSTRAVFDIAGKSMIEIYNQSRNAGYQNLLIRGDAAAALGGTTFPAGSKLFYQISTATTATIGYSPNLSSVVRVYNSAGLVNGESAACDSVPPGTPLGATSKEPATLEEMVAAVRGTPCSHPELTVTGKDGVTLTSGSRNEAWGLPSLAIGTAGNAPLTEPGDTTTFYTTNTLLRVAFGDNNTAKYYACKQRSWDGSVRNCDLIGTGSYAIATLGDARVLSLANTPVQAAMFAERLFIQRGGKVYVGFKSRPGTNPSARLNLAAANSLFTQLGIGTIDPESTFAATPASYEGEWMMWNPASTSTALTALRIRADYNGGNDAYFCQDYDIIGANPVQYACTPLTISAGTGAFSVGVPGDNGVLAGTLNLATGKVTATFTPATGPVETLTGGRR